MITNELKHFGILGMHWGVRRFQNSDGSLTSAGRKRYQKENFKEIKNAYSKENIDPSHPFSTSKQFKEKVTSIAKNQISKEDIETVIKAKNKWLDLVNKSEDFYDSKECRDASKKAYNDTLEYLRKNDPAYVKDIVKKNAGKTTGLDKFHDFRKTYEAFEDSAWDEAKLKWDNSNKGKSSKAADRAWDDFIGKQNQVIDTLIGEHANKKLSSINYNDYRDLAHFSIDWKELEKSVKL